jgi:hypothetical protein
MWYLQNLFFLQTVLMFCTTVFKLFFVFKLNPSNPFHILLHLLEVLIFSFFILRGLAASVISSMMGALSSDSSSLSPGGGGHLRMDKFPESFRIAVIADLDQKSKKEIYEDICAYFENNNKKIKHFDDRLKVGDEVISGPYAAVSKDLKPGDAVKILTEDELNKRNNAKDKK